MQKITRTIIAAAGILIMQQSSAQQNKKLSDSIQPKTLNEVVVTGQYKPQSLKNSVYQVRVINSQRIQLSGATNVQEVLNNQLGFRFSNDNTLGTTDVQLMGVSGRNVKILVDGVPMIDRGDTRESLGQIDVNTIERIEIVEGPMSVSYGSDALAGTINIITKKNRREKFSVTAKAQEETAGNEYYPFSYQGVHTQTVAINSNKNNWNLSVGGTHSDHDGFGGDAYARAKTWKPKEQYLGNIKVGYGNEKFSVYYRLDGMNEDITSRGEIGQNYKANDQHYISDRWLHQLQGNFHFNNKLQLSALAAYTDYQRKTKTTIHDFQKNTEELSVLPGEQDLSKLNSFVFRSTLNYQASAKLSFQPGVDINREEASGARISGDKAIVDYAAFVSAEIKPTASINIRPGLRFIKNSVYDAPPVIPSVNTKFILSKSFDLRLSYGYGFRSPALRELYFSFIDANHNLVGNPDLKAESSNSFNGSLSFTPAALKKLQFTSTLGAFYNDFRNQINLVANPSNPNEYSYYNIDRSKTTGASINNKLNYKNLETSLGFLYTGYSADIYEEKNYLKTDDRNFLWSPEINSDIIYNISKLKTRLGLFYKFIGNKPAFTAATVNNQPAVVLTKTSSYNLADFTVNTSVNRYVTINAGVKNIFDVDNVSNTAVATGVHGTGGAVAIGYGRSYFLGLNIQWNKK
ncbi:MAG: TonB-dependent receptor [Ferruginibacter sp.]